MIVIAIVIVIDIVLIVLNIRVIVSNNIVIIFSPRFRAEKDQLSSPLPLLQSSFFNKVYVFKKHKYSPHSSTKYMFLRNTNTVIILQLNICFRKHKYSPNSSIQYVYVLGYTNTVHTNSPWKLHCSFFTFKESLNSSSLSLRVFTRQRLALRNTNLTKPQFLWSS